MERKHVDVLILGGGLSGYLTHYILKQYTDVQGVGILTDNALNVNAGLFYVHEKIDNVLTRETLRIKSQIHKKSENFKELYSKKVYGKILNNVSISEYEKTAYILDLSALERNADSVILDRALKINAKSKIVETKDCEIRYNTLISTVPAIIFCMLNSDISHLVNYFKYRSIFIKRVFVDIDLDDCDMLITYYPGEELYYRSTTTKSLTVFEYMKHEMDESTHMLYPGKIFVPHRSVLKEMVAFAYNNNIRLVGRYAQWMPKMMLHNVHKRIQEICKEIL